MIITPSGGRISYHHNAAQQLMAVVNPENNRTTFNYDAAGRKIWKKLANGSRESLTYNSVGQVTDLYNLKSDSSVICSYKYTYDNSNNRINMVQDDGARFTWLYDHINQLKVEAFSGSFPYRNTFAYDAVGNRILKNENSARTTYTYDAANQLQNSIDTVGITSFVYDANGNQELILASDGSRTTSLWDYENRQSTTLLPTSRITFSYDPNGLRIRKES